MIGSDEFDGAGFDGFGALGFLAKDEDGLAEGGSFFLDAAGIGDEQVGAAHEVDEGDVIEGWDEMDVGPVGEEAVDGVLDVWVGVNGVDNFDVVARGEAVEGEADTLKTSAETLTAVGGDEDEAFGGVEEGPVNAAGKGPVGETIANVEDGINARVTGNVGSFGGNAFAVEVGGGPGSGGEMDMVLL